MRYVTAIVICVVLLSLFGWWGLAAGVLAASLVLSLAPSKKLSGKSKFTDRWKEEQASASTGRQDQIVITDVAFRSFFQIAGCLAKSDGRISSEEIGLATRVMRQLSLTQDYRKIAIMCFNEGKSQNFDVDRTLNKLQSALGLNRLAGTVLFEAMVDICEVDGFTEQKVALLLLYARAVGVRQHDASYFIQQRQSFDRHNHQQPPTSRASNSIEEAYRTLGVNSRDSDAQVKKAYRRLIQQSHPDRLQAMNLPEFLMEAAHRKTQEIQEAWETVKKIRGLN